VRKVNKMSNFLKEAQRHINILKESGVNHGSLYVAQAQISLAQSEHEALKIELAGLQGRIKQLEDENEKLKGSCVCMDCGKVIKTVEQSKHNKECKNSE